MKKELIIGIVLCCLIFLTLAGLLTYEYTATQTISPKSILIATGILLCTVIFAIRHFNKRMPKDLLAMVDTSPRFRYICEKAFTDEDQQKERKLLLKAISLYNQGKYHRTARICNKLIFQTKNDHDWRTVTFLYAMCCTKCHAYQTAINLYHRLIQEDGTDWYLWYLLANRYKNVGNIENAVQCYQKAIACDPNCPLPYSNLAGVYFDAKDYEKALLYAQRALERDPKLIGALNTVTISLFALGREEEGEKAFEESVKNGAHKWNLRYAINYHVSRLK